MKALLLLGCDGKSNDDFKFCNGVENVIVDLETLERREDYLTILEYLNNIPKVFTRPCCNPNIVSSSISWLYRMDTVAEETYYNAMEFYQLHIKCGVYLRSELKEKNGK